MPVFDITAPDGTKYTVTGPDGSNENQALQQVMAQHQPAPQQQSGPQPSWVDRAVASPAGRLLHDAVVAPILGVGSMLSNIDPTMTPQMRQAPQLLEQPYQASLAANRNTPGYAAARQDADARTKASGGGGFTDQMLAPYLPSLAGGMGLPGGWDSMNANADSQAAAQGKYSDANPVRSFAAGIAGGALAVPDSTLPTLGRLPAAAAKQVAPTEADLKAAARMQYKTVDNSGVRISNDSMNGMADSFADRFAPQIDPILYPKATAAYNRVLQYGTDGEKGAEPSTFAGLDNLRRVVKSAAKSPDSADAGLAGQMIDHIDRFTNGLDVADLDTSLQDALRANVASATSQKGQIARQISSIEANKPGALAARGAAGADTRAAYMDLHEQLPAAEEARLAALGDFKSESDLINGGPQSTIDALKNARGLYSRYKQTQTLNGVIDDAQLNAGKGANPEQALRNGFASLAKNDKQMAQLSPEVRAAVRQVVMGSPVSNVLKYVGKLAPRGIVSTALSTGMGGAVGGVPGAMALPMLGEAARMGSISMTRGAAQRAADVAALGRTAALPPGLRLQLPQLTPQSQLPMGMFGSGLLSQQNPSMARR